MVRVMREVETCRSSDKELSDGKYMLLEIGEMMAANDAVRIMEILAGSLRTLYGVSGWFSASGGGVALSTCAFSVDRAPAGDISNGGICTGLSTSAPCILPAGSLSAAVDDMANIGVYSQAGWFHFRRHCNRTSSRKMSLFICIRGRSI